MNFVVLNIFYLLEYLVFEWIDVVSHKSIVADYLYDMTVTGIVVNCMDRIVGDAVLSRMI